MTYEYQQYLAHYGVKGQKWGQRNYQNEDGSYTAEGAERYWGGGHGRQPGVGPTAPAAPRSAMKRSTLNRVTRGFTRLNAPQKWRKKAYDAVHHPNDTPEQKAARKERRKKIVAISAGVALTAAAAYGVYRMRKNSIVNWMKSNGIQLNVNRGKHGRLGVTQYKGRSIEATGRYSKRDLKRFARQDRALTETNRKLGESFNKERERIIREDAKIDKIRKALFGNKSDKKIHAMIEKQARKKINGVLRGAPSATKKPNYIKSAKRTYDTLRSYASGRSDEHIYKSLKKRKRVGG